MDTIVGPIWTKPDDSTVRIYPRLTRRSLCVTGDRGYISGADTVDEGGEVGVGQAQPK